MESIADEEANGRGRSLAKITPDTTPHIWLFRLLNSRVCAAVLLVRLAPPFLLGKPAEGRGGYYISIIFRIFSEK